MVAAKAVGLTAGLRLTDAAKGFDKFAGALITLVVVQLVAVAALLQRIATSDDVNQQPSLRQPLESGRLMGCQRRRDKAGAKSHQKLQPAGVLGQRGGGQPRVFAPTAGWRQYRFKTQLLGATGDIRQIRQRRRAKATAEGGDVLRIIPRADDLPTVAVGRQIPVQMQTHWLSPCSSTRSVVSWRKRRPGWSSRSWRWPSPCNLSRRVCGSGLRGCRRPRAISSGVINSTKSSKLPGLMA